MSFYDLGTAAPTGKGRETQTPLARAESDEGAGDASSARVTPFVASPALGELITIVQAAEIADRLWHANRLKFRLECLRAANNGVTLLQLIRERIAARLDAYLEYEVTT